MGKAPEFVTTSCTEARRGAVGPDRDGLAGADRAIRQPGGAAIVR
jgi:hypothetical protein